MLPSLRLWVSKTAVLVKWKNAVDEKLNELKNGIAKEDTVQ